MEFEIVHEEPPPPEVIGINLRLELWEAEYLWGYIQAGLKAQGLVSSPETHALRGALKEAGVI